MAEQVVDTGEDEALRTAKAEEAERRFARGVARLLPLVTVLAALGVALFIGPSVAILVLAAGMLLGVIGLFWVSLRVLSGETALSPELEALDAGVHTVDALASRKRMLVRALKDLDNERALGKLEDDDYEQLSTAYREELKELLRRIDSSIEPYRAKAEAAALEYLAEAGVLETGSKRRADGPVDTASTPSITSASEPAGETTRSARLTCPKCTTSNEPDASFCKKCGTTLAREGVEAEAVATADAKEDLDES